LWVVCTGAPQARQVADRFHLLQNLRLTIETELSRADRSTGRALLPNADSDDEIGATISSAQCTVAAQRQIARQTHRRSRQAVFDTIRTLRDRGMSIDNIARQTGFGRRSITNGSSSMHLRTDAQPLCDRVRPAISRSIYRNVGATVYSEVAICSTRSNVAATPAASRTWSGF